MRKKHVETTKLSAQENAAGKSQYAPLCLVVTVVNFGQGGSIIKMMDTSGAATSFSCHGEGTARNEIYDVFGLETSKKSVIITPIRVDMWPGIKKKIETRFSVSKSAKGISFVIKIDSIIGTYAYKYVANERNGIASKGGETPMEEIKKNENYEVIFTIVNDGYSDLVMDAARGVGARGGTIINGKGTGNKEMEKFFGISIAPEKQIVMILVPKSIKSNVLTAIYQAAGLNSKGQGIAFSVPADDVVGLVDIQEKEPQETAK